MSHFSRFVVGTLIVCATLLFLSVVSLMILEPLFGLGILTFLGLAYLAGAGLDWLA